MRDGEMQKSGGEEKEEEDEDESCRQILFLASPVWYEVLPPAPVPLRGIIRVLPDRHTLSQDLWQQFRRRRSPPSMQSEIVVISLARQAVKEETVKNISK